MTFVSRCSVNIFNTVEVQGIYRRLDPPVSYGEQYGASHESRQMKSNVIKARRDTEY
jgi:hypothetical protein